MYIEPNSIIKIYKFLPLNNTYEHTVYFSSRDNQNSYFHANNDRLKYILNRQSYQRVNKNTMRVQLKADDLYDCNYIAFQNSSYGNKWFYAFILSAEYINNETSEITYEIDVIQTYLLDVGLGYCMVEREHTETDNIGEHIASEPINCGDVYCHEFVQTNLFKDYCAIIATGKKGSDEQQYAGGVRGGLFSGIDYMIADINDDEGVNVLLEYLELLVEKGDDEAVVGIFLCPSNTIPYTRYEPRTNVFAIATPTKFSYGYEPRNKKLLTFPYMYLNVDCGTDNIDYRYEWFNSDSTLGLLYFNIISTLSCNPQIQLVPKGYQCDSETMNWSSSIILDGFPQCAWAIDSYKRYLARNATKTNFSILRSAEQAIFSGLFMNVPGVVHGVTNMAETSATAYQAQRYGVAPRGNSNGTVETASRVKDFYFRRMEINEEYAKMVDNFFDMYGYATNTLKLPRYNVRPYWNYIKTNNCVIANSSAPNEASKKISEIFNKGITFWKSMLYVGDYSKDNRPVSE